jgi:hypothetical protein
MKKSWITIILLLIIAIAVILWIFIYNKNNNKGDNIVEYSLNEISEKVTDECTEEMEKIDEEAKVQEIEANSQEEKISPNCLVTLKKYYEECNHTINEYIDIPQNLVNKTEDDLKKQYAGWEVEKYSSTEIVLYREYSEECGQHFVIRNVEGKISIYRINENNEEELYEATDISVDYLTETDKIEIENGIRVNGKEELNQIIEDYE